MVIHARPLPGSKFVLAFRPSVWYIYNQMVVDFLEDEQRADRLFHALADTTRRDILRRAMHGEHSVSDLARCYPMSFAAVQKHVAVLERALLVTKEKRGREQLVRSNMETIGEAQRLLEQLEAVWRSRLDQFGEVLTDQDEGDTE